MLVVDAQQILSLVRMPELIEALRVAFGSGAAAPLRQVAAVPGGRGVRLFMSMPAFAADGSGVTKLVTVFPDNAARGMPTVNASVVVFSVTGVPVALLDGTSLTRLRTAAASALASSYLSGEDSSRLVIVSSATNSSTPIVRGDWVRPGAFVDLVGADSRDMRESDDALVKRARIFVDTFEGAMAEAGDILDPLARGVIAREKVEAELKDLVAGTHPGRQSPEISSCSNRSVPRSKISPPPGW